MNKNGDVKAETEFYKAFHDDTVAVFNADIAKWTWGFNKDDVKTTTCGTVKLAGGYNSMGNRAYLEKQFNTPAHNGLRIQMKLYILG